MTSARILIVEDDRIVARDLQQRLLAFGYSVVGVTPCGEEAVRLALEARPDLVLMDIRLEGPLDGISAAEQIRSRCQAPVVYLTAYADEETLRRARISEPFGYLLKPIEDRELHTVIEMALYKHAAERRLRESERRYAVTLNSIGDAVIATDSRGCVTFMNPVAEALTGWQLSEAIGHTLSEVFHIINELTHAPAEDPVAKVLRLGTVIGLANNTVLVARNGQEVPIDDCGAPIRDDDKHIAGVVLVFHDVTARRQSEQALTLFRELLDRTNDAIEVVDPETGRFLDVNETACLALGYSREEYLARSVFDIEIASVQRSTWKAYVEDLRSSGSRVLEGLHRRKDGSTVPVEVNVNYIALERDYLVAVVRDITERKRAEETLRQAEANYRSIFDNAIEGIYQSTPGGRFLTANPALARMLGYSSPEELLNSVQDIARQLWVEPERRVEYTRSLEEQGLVQGFECQVYRKDGSKIWIALSTRVVHNSRDGVPYYEGAVVEITERKRLEEQFRQAQKMEALGQLAGGVAHDFNNLLTVISGYCDILLNDMRFEDPSRPMIDEIRRAGERAATLTHQLLAFSRKQLVAPRALDVNALVSNMEKMLRRLIGEHITLVTILSPDLGHVKADPGQIEQVVLNLVVNARDAMPRGGELTLETGNEELTGPLVPSQVDVRPGPFVKLTVRDMGSGMSTEVMARIFEPFFTTKEMGKGTGLGLATVYGIIKQHGGYIQVESEPGRGTTFHVHLPRIHEPVPSQGPDSGLALWRAGRETVLVVEDEEQVRRLTSRSLETGGYTVLEARDGAEALEVAERYQGSIDLLLTDVVMPGMSGQELAERFYAARPSIKVLYLSGYTDDFNLFNEALGPGVATLQKPYTVRTLLRKVRDVLDPH
jgi:PAS domain S-box-containing protein